jgi:hypothetical protein
MATPTDAECGYAERHGRRERLMADYGDATIRQEPDGTFTVTRADDVIGVSVDALTDAHPGALRVTSEGHLSMGSDGMTLYRPVRFDPAMIGPRVLICERVPVTLDVHDSYLTAGG